MKIPLLTPKKPLDMSESELESGIRRCDKTLNKWPHLGTVVAHATIILAPVGGIAALALGGWVFTPFVGLATLATGLGTFFGGGYSYKAVMMHAQRKREGFMDALEQKVEARLEAERWSAVKILENFNAHVDAGLPLERSIEVKKALRLKFPQPPVPDDRAGFARIFAPRPVSGRGL
jgi:hypothetical protein